MFLWQTQTQRTEKLKEPCAHEKQLKMMHKKQLKKMLLAAANKTGNCFFEFLFFRANCVGARGFLIVFWFYQKSVVNFNLK